MATTGIRINAAKNFAGDLYATQKWVLAELTKLGLGTDFNWTDIYAEINAAIAAVDKKADSAIAKFGTMAAGKIATANAEGTALEYVNSIVTAVAAEEAAADANIPTEKAVRIAIDAAVDKIAAEAIGVAAGDGIAIELVDDTNVISTTLRLEAIEVKDTDSDKDTVSKRYALVHGEGDAKKTVGDIINIPKDQFLKDAKFEGKSLVLTFNLVNGESNVVTIPLDDLVDVYKAGNGLSERPTEDGTFFDVTVDTASEKVVTGKDAEGNNITSDVISVGADGVKAANVQTAIDYAVATKAAEIAEDIDAVSDAVDAVKEVAIKLVEATVTVPAATTGVFTTTVAGRVISVYGEEGVIYPEIKYANGTTTLTADFGDKVVGEAGEAWTVVVAKPLASN